MYRHAIKRLLDILLSMFAIAALSPLLLFFAAWVKLDSPGPVLFRQKRVGMSKRLFAIFKYRTMRTDAPHDVPTHMLEDPARWITRSGRFLRASSLDELPQLFNILKGDMSFIGPRPALWNQYDLIAARDACGANDLPQGLTGWAQINGRDDLAISAKAALDGEYAARFGFLMDCRCFFGTVGKVLKHEGVREGVREDGAGVGGKRSREAAEKENTNA